VVEKPLMERSEVASMFLHFMLLSLMAIGGVSTVLPDMQRYVVEANAWLSGKQFADAYALGQAAPGPNLMFVTLIGWQVAGFAGAIATTVAVTGPPLLLTLMVTRYSASNPDAPLGLAIRRGLAPLTIGLMLASGWILLSSADHDWRGFVLTAVTIGVVLRTRLNPLWLIVGGALLGIGGLV
jgi:chromate transporter